MKVTAPYNFVPLSKQICTSADIGLEGSPSQDAPIENAHNGSIGFTLTCNTPLLIGDGGEEKHFIEDPDSQDPVIPGSSLRGMIRNVMEIATFARFAFVDNTRVGVRDLSPTARLDYGARLNDVKAGWLLFDNNSGTLKLQKCKHIQIQHTRLNVLSSGFANRIGALAKKTQAEERGAKQVQAAFGNAHSVNFSKSGDEAVIDPKGQDGTLVFTGLPGTRKDGKNEVSSKLREFIFFGQDGEVEVSSDVWSKFIAVHEAREAKSATWEWRRKTFRQGRKIPVFWLPDENGKPDQIGLAGMFRIAADNSIHDLISDDHVKDDGSPDLPTRIFGRANKTNSFKTRVSFGFARLTSQSSEIRHEVIAASPKPGFVPSYIRQRDFCGAEGTTLLAWDREDYNGQVMLNRNGKPIRDKAQYRSYMDWNNAKEELRGWKRYPAQGDSPPDPPSGSGESASVLWPVSNPGGLTFEGRIRYHNLHLIELGALIWALTWGGDETLRHGLGMGKPFGWGQVAISLVEDFPEALEAFTDAMQIWAAKSNIPGGWAASTQIIQLKAMADPVLGEARADKHLKKMVLSLDPKRNDFKCAKDALQVLPEYADSVLLIARSIDPAQIKTDATITETVRESIANFNQLKRRYELQVSQIPEHQTTFAKKQKVLIKSLGLTGTVGKNRKGEKYAVSYQTIYDIRKGCWSSEYFSPSDLEPIDDKP